MGIKKANIQDDITPLQAWNAIATGLMVVDQSGHLLWVNHACENLLGRPFKAGETVFQFLPDTKDWFKNESVSDEIASALAEMSLERIRPAGRPEQVRVRVTMMGLNQALRDALAPLGQAVSLIEMVTIEEALRIERDEVTGRALDANRDLIRNLAHEIKNPLGGIQGAAQLLLSDLTDDSHKECLNIVINECKRLQGLVDRFLAPYRSEQNEQAVNVHEVLEYVQSLIEMQYQDAIKFERDYDISAPDLHIDKTRLTQIFLNLIQNAAQALTGSSAKPDVDKRIVLKTRLVRDVLIGKKRERLALAIEVKDTGPGIPADIKPLIFYPLITGRADGTGLGLSLVQNFVHQAQGSITVDSDSTGTVFKVIFPYPQKAKKRPKN